MASIDLHMHSNYSLDGEYSPAMLMRQCKSAGVSIASLTDHNSVRGVEEASEEGRKLGITVLPGVELDCTYKGVDLHLLGYNIDYRDSCYQQVEQEILEQKQKISRQQIEEISRLGIHLDVSQVMELARDGVVTGEMIAQAALADPANDGQPLLAPYRPGGDRSDNPYVNFFWDFCAQGRPAFLPVCYMSFDQANDLIRRTGGFSVIAHPVCTVGKDEEAIRYMAAAGVRGIEAYSSYHSREDMDYYQKLARSLGLLATMGSDYHGETKPSVRLGINGGDGREKELGAFIYSVFVV